MHAEVLEPIGFVLHKYDAPGYGLYASLRLLRGGLLEGIGVSSGLLPHAFRVELGVVPSGGNFFRAALSKKGQWRKLGIRMSLGPIIHATGSALSPNQKDFFFYRDQESLEGQLRLAFRLALEHGPRVWREFERSLARQS